MFLLLGFRDHVGNEDGDSIGVAWTAWRLCGALAIVVFLVALLIASRLLVKPSRWGLSTVVGRRQLCLGIVDFDTAATEATRHAVGDAEVQLDGLAHAFDLPPTRSRTLLTCRKP
ncbi:hypothetical protein [Kribbella sp. VKM Ac-2500]|uniref:hypothetical protein n=1 Tax=Kribbella sp. VKM Ac-2500 TaxID=2512214 RepID=UPI001047D5EC|nr:hypothetical protein [Kribbella sp. VKM Ac-2500]